MKQVYICIYVYVWNVMNDEVGNVGIFFIRIH